MGTYVRSIAGVIALAGACVMYTAGAVSYAEVEKAHSTMLLLTQTDNDRTAEVHIGGSVRINLAENATTGFRWAIDRYDEKLHSGQKRSPRRPKRSRKSPPIAGSLPSPGNLQVRKIANQTVMSAPLVPRIVSRSHCSPRSGNAPPRFLQSRG